MLLGLILYTCILIGVGGMFSQEKYQVYFQVTRLLKSHHRVIKIIASDNFRAPTATVLNMILPRLILHNCINLSTQACRHFCEGTRFKRLTRSPQWLF